MREARLIKALSANGRTAETDHQFFSDGQLLQEELEQNYVPLTTIISDVYSKLFATMFFKRQLRLIERLLGASPVNIWSYSQRLYVRKEDVALLKNALSKAKANTDSGRV